MPEGTQQGPGKDLKDFENTPRSPLASYMLKAAVEKHDEIKRRSHYLLAAFLPKAFWHWMTNYFSNRFGKKHKFQYYWDPSHDNGIYRLGDDSLVGGQSDPNAEIRVSLAGDWGTGTDESNEVANQIKQFKPHYTIHLGDIYYVGDETEVKENCLGIPDPGHSFTPGLWPLGSVGSFALSGNHEMYALGDAYFDLFLPRLGMRTSPGGAPSGQNASFFCLENEWWRIIGLDTGYNSSGIPILEYFFRPNCQLRDELLEWIRGQVKPRDDKRGIILLSHHQYYSAFQDWYPKPAEQLRQLIDEPVLWFWGHEHRIAVYGKYKTRAGTEAYGRCIGHGGMPVDINCPVQHPECPLVLYDDRIYRSPEDIRVGYNGFANLTFKKNQLSIDYRDLKGDQLLTETWQVVDGVFTGKGIQLINADPGLKHEPDLNRAVR